jgi:hypothetical protein
VVPWRKRQALSASSIQRATTVILARQNYPNNPASLIQHPSAQPDDNSGCHPDRRTNVRIRFSTEFAI